MGAFFSRRRLLGLLFLLSGAILLRETYTFEGGFLAEEGAMGPMSYPRFLLFAWLGASALYFCFPGPGRGREHRQEP